MIQLHTFFCHHLGHLYENNFQYLLFFLSFLDIAEEFKRFLFVLQHLLVERSLLLSVHAFALGRLRFDKMIKALQFNCCTIGSPEPAIRLTFLICVIIHNDDDYFSLQLFPDVCSGFLLLVICKLQVDAGKTNVKNCCSTLLLQRLPLFMPVSAGREANFPKCLYMMVSFPVRMFIRTSVFAPRPLIVVPVYSHFPLGILGWPVSGSMGWSSVCFFVL